MEKKTYKEWCPVIEAKYNLQIIDDDGGRQLASEGNTAKLLTIEEAEKYFLLNTVQGEVGRFVTTKIEEAKEYFLLTKQDLDRRICDCESCDAPDTYREYIRESEDAFSMAPADIDSMEDQELREYVEFLDYLWTK